MCPASDEGGSLDRAGRKKLKLGGWATLKIGITSSKLCHLSFTQILPIQCVLALSPTSIQPGTDTRVHTDTHTRRQW